MEHAAEHTGIDQGKAPPGSWSWFKEWTGYIVTVLPYVSSALVLIPGIAVPVKFGILGFFALVVILVRIVHEKAGVEVTSEAEKEKKPHAVR